MIFKKHRNERKKKRSLEVELGSREHMRLPSDVILCGSLQKERDMPADRWQEREKVILRTGMRGEAIIDK